MKLHLIACAALLAAIPLVSSFAAEPSVGAGNNGEASTIKDGAANNTQGAGYTSVAPTQSGSGMTPMNAGPMAAAPVGSGTVPGDNSTVAGDRTGTIVTRTEAGGAGNASR